MSPLTRARVEWETCLVDVLPESRTGAAHDIAHVVTTLGVEGFGQESFLVTAGAPLASPPVLSHDGEERRLEEVGRDGWRASLHFRGLKLLRFSLQQWVEPVEGGGYELRVAGPPAARPAPLVVALPRVPSRLVTIQWSYAEDPPGTPAVSGAEEELAGRRFVTHLWSDPDPVFVVRYAYST